MPTLAQQKIYRMQPSLNAILIGEIPSFELNSVSKGWPHTQNLYNIIGMEMPNTDWVYSTVASVKWVVPTDEPFSGPANYVTIKIIIGWF